MLRNRAVLCVPGHDLRKVEGCRRYGAGLILFDLEDSVSEADKDLALSVVADHVQPGDAVRLCHPTHPRFQSQWNALDGKVDTVWIPKLDRVDDLKAAYGPWNVVALIESPLGLLNLGHILDCGVAGLAFGRYDFMASTGITDIWSPLIGHAMGQLSLAAHAAGIEVSDAPCYSVTDTDLMRREVERARGYGFSTKGCIHPAQIAVCEGLRPDVALQVPSSISGAVALIDGGLVGPPMRRLAERIAADG